MFMSTHSLWPFCLKCGRLTYRSQARRRQRIKGFGVGFFGMAQAGLCLRGGGAHGLKRRHQQRVHNAAQALLVHRAVVERGQGVHALRPGALAAPQSAHISPMRGARLRHDTGPTLAHPRGQDERSSYQAATSVQEYDIDAGRHGGCAQHPCTTLQRPLPLRMVAQRHGTTQLHLIAVQAKSVVNMSYVQALQH